MKDHNLKQYNRKKGHISAVALLLAASVFLSGCAGNISFMEKEKEEPEFAMETLGLEPDFSYERKAESPNIQVDRLGYLPGSSKTAVFQGQELPDRFQVIEKDSGECVYEGDIRIREDAHGRCPHGIWQFHGAGERRKLLYQMRENRMLLLF